MNKITKAVIPAAGHGTRFMPVTKAVPKELLPIIDKPSIHYIAEEAAASGITDILVIINRDKESVKKYFEVDPENRRGELGELLGKVNFTFAYQDERRGTADAVRLARDFTSDEAFAVMYGDDVVFSPSEPCLSQLIDAYYRTGKTVLGVRNCAPEEAVKYAVVTKGRTDGNLTEVLGLVEKPAADNLPSTLSSLGRYILTPSIYAAIEKTPPVNSEIYLSTAIAQLINGGGVVACEFEGQRFDTGDKYGYLKANVEFGLMRYGSGFAEYLKDLIR